MKTMLNIACLPVAGVENPYQSLMIEGLNKSNNLHAFNGIDNRFLGILKTALQLKPDYIHFDWIQSYYERKKLWMSILLLPFFYFQVLFVKYFTKTKLVWTLHNVLPHNVKHIWLHKLVRRFFASKCHWIRVFSESSIDRAVTQLGVSKDKFKVIPEGDYVAKYPNTVTKEEARKILDIHTSKIVLLSLGFIKPYKGLENLIKTFSEIENSNMELVIAGQSMDSIYTEGLKKLIKSNSKPLIHLIDNFIPTNKLQDFYNAADIVVLPFNKIENSGSVIMAMGFKKAVLAPKMGVLEKRLTDQSFLLYDDLQEGLKVFSNLNKDYLYEIGKKNYLALKKYKWKDFEVAFSCKE